MAGNTKRSTLKSLADKSAEAHGTNICRRYVRQPYHRHRSKKFPRVVTSLCVPPNPNYAEAILDTAVNSSLHLSGALRAIQDYKATISALLAADSDRQIISAGGNLFSVLEETIRRIDRHGLKISFFEADGAKLEAAMEIASEKVWTDKKLPYKATLDNLAHPWVLLHIFSGTLISRIKTTISVAVDFYLLKEDYDYDDYGLPLLSPVEPGFCRKKPNSDNSDVIDSVVDPDALYWIKITNNTSRDLYLSVFLFKFEHRPEAPLKQGGTFILGYGPGGAPPFAYSLAGNQDTDVGYLKIFFATRHVDMSNVMQVSPFSNMKARDWTDDDARGARLPLTRPPELVHTWFTLDIPVVQRRRVAGQGAVP
ncbi:hypothetical protein J3R83DRAFT_1472 [Lanmaoa asiatica]|nr:hypothetical protein J3R83DRAFT_1472 [Lanmaoa asiatica]